MSFSIETMNPDCLQFTFFLQINWKRVLACRWAGYICTPVGTLRLCEDRLFGEGYEPHWTGLCQAGLAKRRRVLSPEAAVPCQAGRVATDSVPRLSAQVVEQQHRLVCFTANSSLTPYPDHCLLCLCTLALTQLPTPTYLLFFLDFTTPTPAFTTKLKVILAFVGEQLLHASTGVQQRVRTSKCQQ